MGLFDFAKKLADTIGLDGKFGYQGTWTPPAPQPTQQQRQIAASIAPGASIGPAAVAKPPAQIPIAQAQAAMPTPTAPTPAPIFKVAPPPIQAPKINMPLETAKQAVQGIGNSAVDLFHGITRISPTVLASVAQPGADALNNILGNPNTPITIDPAKLPGGTFLFGKDPVQTYQSQAEKFSQQLKALGVGDTTANAASIPAAGIMAGLDLTPGGKGESAVAKDLAKASSVSKVVQTLIKHFGEEKAAQAPAQLIDALAKTKSPQRIARILGDTKPTVSPDEMARAIGLPEAPKVSTADAQAARMGTERPHIPTPEPEAGQPTIPGSTTPPEAAPVFKPGSKLNGIKGFPEQVKTRFMDWYNQRQAAKVDAMKAKQEFQDLDAGGMDTIHAFQKGDTTGRLGDLRQYFEGKFQQLQDAGVHLGHQENYITQLWKESPQEVEQKLGGHFTLQGSISLPRVLDNYEQGIKAGLTPKFKNVSDIVGWYEGYTNKLLADRQFFNELIANGHVRSAEEAPKSWKTLNPDYFPTFKTTQLDGTKYTGVYKAPAPLVEALDRTMKPRDAGKLTKFIRGGKQLLMGGGVPGTGLNYHGAVNLASRLAVSKPQQLAHAYWYMTNVRSASRFLNSHLNELGEFTRGGMNLSYEGLGHLVQGEPREKGLLALHSRLFEDPGFGKAYPAMQMRWAMAERDALMKRNIPRDEAVRIAAHSSNDMFSGTNIGEIARDPKFQESLSNVFLAPQWGGTNINLGKKMIMGLLHPTDPRYRAYRRVAVGVGSVYVLGNLINKQLSGHYMWENAPGQQFSVDTGSTDGGKERFLSLFGTSADYARVPIDMASGIKSGDLSVIARTIRNRLSTVMGTAVTLMSGTDYLGQNIYQDKNGNPLSGGQQALAVAGALGGLGAPAQVTAGLKYASGELTGEQAANAAFEGPLKYKKVLPQDAQTYIGLSDQYRQQLNNSDEQAIWDYLHSSGRTNQGQKIENQYDLKSATGKYAMFFEHPDLLAKETAFQRELRDRTSQQIDPFYDLTPDQQQAELLVKLYNKLAPGELGQDKAALKQQLPADFQQKQTDYYNYLDQKLGTLTSSGANQYPQTTSQQQSLIDQYNALGGNTKAKAAFKAAHPELQDYWNQVDSYYNSRRSAIGLPTLADVSPYPQKANTGGSRGGSRRTGKGSRGGKIAIRKVASPKTPSIKVAKTKGPKLAKPKVAAIPRVKIARAKVKLPKLPKLA